jgi:HAD superfamily hydrolase (TIGR01509 family)
MIKGIIFDFDGVLIDSEYINIEAGTRAFRDFGYELSPADKQLIPGKHSEDVVAEILKLKGWKLQEKSIIDRYAEIYDGMWGNGVVIAPRSKEVLSILKGRGIVLALATNNSRPRVDWFLQKISGEDIFSVVISGDDVTRRKPDPEIYIKAKSSLGFSDELLLAVEDSPSGLMAAKGAGLRCAMIVNQYNLHNAFPGADQVFTSLQELPDYFSSEFLR